jgi:hypothetical protein
VERHIQDCRQEVKCTNIGAIVGCTGVILGCVDAILWPSWAILGPSRGHRGAISGPSCAVSGPSWGHVAPSCVIGHARAIFWPSWAILRPYCENCVAILALVRLMFGGTCVVGSDEPQFRRTNTCFAKVPKLKLEASWALHRGLMGVCGGLLGVCTRLLEVCWRVGLDAEGWGVWELKPYEQPLVSTSCFAEPQIWQRGPVWSGYGFWGPIGGL